MPPTAPAPWRGVREALAWGPTAPQTVGPRAADPAEGVARGRQHLRKQGHDLPAAPGAPRFADDAFSGEGARRHGGRWNSRGRSVVYAASSVPLASLEVYDPVSGVFVLDFLLALGAYTSLRLAARAVQSAVRRREVNLIPTLVVGRGREAALCVREMRARRELGYRVIGIVEAGVPADDAPREFEGVPVVADLSTLPEDLRDAVSRDRQALSSPPLVASAKTAVARVLQSSELQELWADSSSQEWFSEMNNLLARLQ